VFSSFCFSPSEKEGGLFLPKQIPLFLQTCGGLILFEIPLQQALEGFAVTGFIFRWNAYGSII